METATVGVLIALSASHMLNDVMQSLAPALYPVFRERFALSFFQIGLITFVFQLTASFLQPVIGMSLDKRPLNFILPSGMAFTLVGLVLLAELVLVSVSWAVTTSGAVAPAVLPPGGVALSNTRALGDILYTRYLFAFQGAGLILLVAMIGAIVLTLRRRADVRRQSIASQLARTRAQSVEVVKVPVGGGV